MEFRLSQRHIVAINFLLIVVIAYFAARSVNQVVALFVAAPPTAAPQAAARFRSAAGSHPQSYYQEIVNRDVFNLKPVPTAISHVETAVDLHLQLLGTSLTTRQKPYAIIEDHAGHQSLYQLGQDIPDAGKLIKVEKNRVIIQHGARRVALQIPETPMPAALPMKHGFVRPRLWMGARGMGRRLGPAARRHEHGRMPDIDVQDQGENHYSLSRNDVRKALQHRRQLLSEIKATPHMNNGRPDGYTLSAIQPGSVFDDLGLQDGDRLTVVNGIQVRSVGQAYAMMGALQTTSAIEITVIRDGVPVQLHYALH